MAYYLLNPDAGASHHAEYVGSRLENYAQVRYGVDIVAMVDNNLPAPAQQPAVGGVGRMSNKQFLAFIDDRYGGDVRRLYSASFGDVARFFRDSGIAMNEQLIRALQHRVAPPRRSLLERIVHHTPLFDF